MPLSIPECKWEYRHAIVLGNLIKYWVAGGGRGMIWASLPSKRSSNTPMLVTSCYRDRDSLCCSGEPAALTGS